MNEEDEVIARWYCTDYGCEKFGRIFYMTKNGSILPNQFLIEDDLE